MSFSLRSKPSMKTSPLYPVTGGFRFGGPAPALTAKKLFPALNSFQNKTKFSPVPKLNVLENLNALKHRCTLTNTQCDTPEGLSLLTLVGVKVKGRASVRASQAGFFLKKCRKSKVSFWCKHICLHDGHTHTRRESVRKKVRQKSADR